jgi:hypothetical protein
VIAVSDAQSWKDFVYVARQSIAGRAPNADSFREFHQCRETAITG